MAKIIRGKVVSSKSKNTVVVEIERTFAHHMYKKKVRRTSRFKAHYNGEPIKEGQTVTLVEIPPVSKDKHFKVLEEKKK